MKNITINKDGTPRKSGSGRTKGATSFTNVSLIELNKLCGSSAVIPVSRKWLENMGINVEPTTPPVVKNIAPEPEAKITFKLHE